MEKQVIFIDHSLLLNPAKGNARQSFSVPAKGNARQSAGKIIGDALCKRWEALLGVKKKITCSRNAYNSMAKGSGIAFLCSQQPQYPHHPCLEEMPHLQPSQEESSSSSTPLILQQPELEQSQNVEINEDVNFGDDLLVDFDLDFDFEQVILTDDYHLSNK
ncbi:hypothetical protein QYF36_021358 [Acer negundo]|nr:hypothetical protein QYF36_021358 [Acer negundo]